MWLSILSVLSFLCGIILQILSLIDKAKLSDQQKRNRLIISVVLVLISGIKPLYEIINKPSSPPAPKAAVPKIVHDTIHDPAKRPVKPIVSIFQGVDTKVLNKPGFERNNDSLATVYFQLRVLNKADIESVGFQIKGVSKQRGLYHAMGLINDNQTHNAINDGFVRYVVQPLGNFKKKDTIYLRITFDYKISGEKKVNKVSENYMVTESQVSDIPMLLLKDVTKRLNTLK